MKKRKGEEVDFIVKTKGVWQGRMTVLCDGEAKHYAVNDGTQEFTAYIKAKNSVAVEVDGVRSEGFGVSIECEPQQ